MKKRALSIILAMILLISILPIQANANQLDNGLWYTVYADHVEITGYSGKATEFVIPAEIEGLPVTVIGKLAFQCSDLISISIPDSVTSIRDSAFYWCENLTSIYIPDSVTSIGATPFRYCFSLNEILVDENNPVYSNDDRGVLFNKAKTRLIQAPCAISGSYMIPDGVTSIVDSAFEDCNSLVTVYIPDTLTSMNASAFYSCDSLNGIYADENNPVYSSDEQGVLFDKEKAKLILAPGAITDYVIPDGVTSIGKSAFYGCYNLTTIDFPDSLISIGDDAFHACSSLTAIDLPDSVTSIGESAFEFCTSLASVKLPNGPVSIGDYAFGYCDGLTSIDIPDGITSISPGTFFYCRYLTSVSIPDGVTSIGEEAFEFCGSLTTVNIPDSVTSIGYLAFTSCNSLTSISIPDSVTSIGSNAFGHCNNLTGIYVDENNPNYSNDDHGVFFNKEKTVLIQAPCAITGSYTIPDSVTSIDSDAFEACKKLTGIDIPDSVTSIGHYAFSSCKGLTHIIFQGDAPQFGINVFYSATATAYYPIGNTTWTEDILQDYGGEITWVAFDPLHIHEYTATVTAPTCTEDGFTTFTCSCGDSYVGDYIGALGHDYANSICPRCGRTNDDLQYKIYEDHVEILSYTGSDSTVVIPAEIEGLPVTVITGYAFKNCTNLITITIPDTVTSIESIAFYYCPSLRRIIFQGNAPQFGTSAFYDVVAVAYYPSNNTTWTEDVMLDYGGAIVWSSDALSPPHDFHDTIVAPSSCTAWSYTIYTCSDCGYTFERCNVPPQGHYYENNVCSYCGWVDIGFNYVSYEDHVEITKYTRSDRNVVIPAEIEGKAVTVIGTSVFHDDYQLTSVSIPDSVTSIGALAFTNCHNLATINIPDSVTSIGYGAFWWCQSLTKISIPDGVTSIQERTFYACASLRTIDIPDSVTSIADSAFYYCPSLTTIDIPANVTFIGDSAFSGCSNLKSISFKGDAPQFGSNIFNNVTTTAYYPADNATWTEDVMQDYGGDITWVPNGSTATDNPFSDVPAGSWYEEPVLWAMENGITSGTSANSFSPNDPCLRSHVATFLWRAAGYPEPTLTTNRFDDVNGGDFFYKPVLWAVEKGITSGLSATHFGSYDVCSRAQVVAFLWRAAGCPEPTSTVNPFTDVKPGDYFYKSVLWAVENGVTSGISATLFGPNDACTRAQVVTFLYRVYN